MKCASAMAVCLCLAASTAHAQTHPTTGVFLQGGIFASIERLPHIDPGPDVTPFMFGDQGGTVAGGTIGIGAFLRPFLTLRVEFALPATLDHREEEVVSGLSVSSGSQVQNRDAYVLLGFETNADRRIRLSYLAGAVVRQQRVSSVVRFMTGGLPPFLPPRLQILEQTSVAYGTSLALGLDAAVAMSRHGSLVPHLRVVVFGGTLSVRPGASVRWSF